MIPPKAGSLKVDILGMEIRFRFKIFSLSLAFAAVLNILLWLIIWFKFPPSDIPYAIRYSILSGADIFGTQNTLLVLPTLGSAMLIINGLLAFLLRKKEVFLSYVFLVMSVIVQLFLLIALFGLLKFNGQI